VGDFKMGVVRDIGELNFVIYPNDHLPIHVHVKCGRDEAIFRIIDGDVSYHEDRGLSNRHVRDAQEEIEDNIDFYVEKWEELNN
jgi:Domain of unknown function (DUF4160)